MCTNSWIELISIRGSRKTSNRERGSLRLSLRRGGISGRMDTTINGLREIMLGSQDPPILKRLVQCSEN